MTAPFPAHKRCPAAPSKATRSYPKPVPTMPPQTRLTAFRRGNNPPRCYSSSHILPLSLSSSANTGQMLQLSKLVNYPSLLLIPLFQFRKCPPSTLSSRGAISRLLRSHESLRGPVQALAVFQFLSLCIQ